MKKQTQIALLLGIIGLIVVPLSVKQFAAAPTLQVKLLNGAATVLDKIGAPIKANGLRDQAERIANNRTLFILEFASNAEYEKMSEAVWDGYDQKTKYVRIRLGDDDRTMEVTVDSNAAAWARTPSAPRRKCPTHQSPIMIEVPPARIPEESGAVIPHAGICEGGVGQPASLP